MKNDILLKKIKFEKGKIFFESNNSWSFCLNAFKSENNKIYYLLDNEINRKKIKEINENIIIVNKFFDSKNEKKKLRDYQKEDVEKLSKLKSVAIFSEMRTGKTPIALSIFKKWKKKKMLIIVPGILQNHWQISVEEWLEEPAYLISDLNPKLRFFFYKKIFLEKKNLIIIVSKDIFKIDSNNELFKKQIKTNKDICVIIDEAHFLRNHLSQQSKSIYKLKNIEYKIALTGTPIVNNHTDIFGILKFINKKKYSSYWKFVKEYFEINEIKFLKEKKNYKFIQIKDFKNEEKKNELKKELKEFSVNRKQKDVLSWIPPIIYEKKYLLMEKKQEKKYEKIKKIWKDKYQTLKLLTKLKTLTLYPPLLKVKELGIKIKFIVDFIEEEKNNNSLIIFSTRSNTFLEPLSEILKNKNILIDKIFGKITRKQKEENIKKFQEGKIKILLCNIKSSGFGINLSKAETIIFADRSYSPSDNEQAEARFLPVNEKESKKILLIIDLICKNTIDEKIITLLEKKKNITKIINNEPDYFFT